MRRLLIAFLFSFLGITGAAAQAIGPNYSISASSGASANVQITGSKSNYPSAIIFPAPGTSVEVFYALGTTSGVAATTSSPSLPSGGICINLGPTTYVAAITASSSASVRIQQMTGCTTFAGGSGGGGGGSSGAVFGPTAAGSAAANPPVLVGGTADGTGTGNVTNWKVISGVGYVNCANCSSSGVSQQDNTGFTYGSTDFVPIGGVYNASITNLTSGNGGAAALTADRNLFVNINKLANTALGAPSAYGTSPGAVEVPGMNAYVTNNVVVEPGNTPNTTAWLVTGTGGTFPVTGTFWPYSLGQQLAASSVPVVLTAAQLSTLTPPIWSSSNLIGNTGFNALQGSSAQSATNGGYENILQGNAALSATNGLYANILQGNAVLSTTNPIFDSVIKWGGTTLGAASNYGTSPGAVEVPGVNAYITNSVGVTGTFWQTTQPVSVASGGIASGGLASGSIAAGAMVDLLTMRGSASGGTAAADAILNGGIYNSSAPTLTTGQQASLQLDASGNLDVNIKAGAGSGGTALADQATFTQGTTSETPMGCLYISSYSAGTTGKSTIMQCDSTGHPLVNPGTIATWGLAAVGGATAPTNQQAIGAEYLSSPPSYSTGQTGVLQMTAAGSLHTTVDNTLTAINMEQAGLSASTSGSPVIASIAAYNGSTLDVLEDDANRNLKVTPQVTTTGGWTPVFKASLSTTVFSIKSSAGQLAKVTCDGTNTVLAYLQIFNLASGSVSLGTTTPVDVEPLQVGLNSGFAMSGEGLQFGTAISAAVTTTPTGSTATGTPPNCSFAYN